MNNLCDGIFILFNITLCLIILFFSNCQSMLPATGAPVSRQRTNKIKEMFDEYVRVRTRDNWKFWIVSFVI